MVVYLQLNDSALRFRKIYTYLLVILNVKFAKFQLNIKFWIYTISYTKMHTITMPYIYMIKNEIEFATFYNDNSANIICSHAKKFNEII